MIPESTYYTNDAYVLSNMIRTEENLVYGEFHDFPLGKDLRLITTKFGDLKSIVGDSRIRRINCGIRIYQV